MDVDGLPQLSRGDKDEWVEYLQQELEKAGYSVGLIDSDFGDDTEAALIRFQSAVGIPATGAVDTETWRQLLAHAGADAHDASTEDTGGEHTGDDYLHPGHAQWQMVKTQAGVKARDRLHSLTAGVQTGVRSFTRDAGKVIRENIKEPPSTPSGFGAALDLVSSVCEVFLPGVKYAEEFYDAVKILVSTLKPAAEMVGELDKVVAARTVEEARQQLLDQADWIVDVADHNAANALEEALKAVDRSLEALLTAYPLPARHDDEFLYGLCDSIGIPDVDTDYVADYTTNTLMREFLAHFLIQTASFNFFRDLDDDQERLDFLMDEAEKGNDPEALLDLIGADTAYWHRYLEIYRADGRAAAQAALRMGV